MPLQPRSLEHRLAELERQIADLRTGRGAISGDGTDTFLREGDFIVTGGDIRVLDNGDITIDGGRLVAGPTTVDASGVQVGSDVEVNASGLHVIGGLVTPVWPFGAGASTSNVSLTTTSTDFLTRTINPPSWVERLTLIAIARLQMSNTSGGGQLLQCGITNDDGGPFEDRVTGSAGTHQTNSPATNATTVANREDIPLSPAGRSVDVVMDASVNSGTNSSNFLSMSIIGFGTRN